MKSKVFAILNVLLISAALVWSQHGRSGPQPDGVGSPGGPFSSSLYDGAAAWYKFNDPDDLGLDSSGNSIDLTSYNSPTAGGGALVYSTHFTAASSEAAKINDNASLSQGTNQDFGFCLWTVTGTVVDAIASYLLAKTQVEYFIAENGVNKFQFEVIDSVSGSTNIQWGSAETNNTRYFVCGWYTSSDGFANIVVDDGTPLKDASSPISIPVDTAQNFAIGARNDTGGNPYDGNIGPVWYYKGAVPPYAALYNSGKGYTCAASIAAGLGTNLESCWPMAEDGGPYVDSVGSNDLTGVNTPTRGSALVEQPESGMSYLTADVNHAGHMETDDNGHGLTFDPAADFTTSMWRLVPVNHSGVGYVVQNGDDQADDQWSWTDPTTGRVGCQFYDTDFAIARTVDGRGLNTGAWHHFTCVYTASDKTMRLYMDGDNLAGGGGIPTDTFDGVNAEPDEIFRMDDRGVVNNSGFNGAMDDVAVWVGIAKDGTWRDAIYNSGAGVFYAAVIDFMFNNPFLPWSQKPEIVRA